MLAIVEFSPTRGGPGESVRIFGNEFSPSLRENRVTFNRGGSREGAPALVLAATPTTIVTRVPAGATTGPITVSTPAGSASSNEPFTVIELAALSGPTGRPQVLAFAPPLVAAGDRAIVTGAGYSTVATDNTVLLNGVASEVLSATPTELEIRVPPRAGSGRITVTTSLGTSMSSRDLLVVPAPYTVADVGCTGRLLVNGNPRTFTLTRPQALALDLVGLIVFDGSARQGLTLVLGDLTIPEADVSVRGPDTTPLLGPTGVNAGEGGRQLALPPLPAAGTYQILVAPRRMHTGTLTLALVASD